MSEEETAKTNVLDSMKPTETKRIVKNVMVISIAFMIQFTAYVGAANLQSSVNAEAALGTASLAAVYIGFIVSNIFLTSIIIKWLGTKWTISLSFLSYMPFLAVQLWPRSYTLIPTGLLLGLGGGPLWCAKCIYISVVSEVYCKISNVSAEAILVHFMGLFFMIYQLSQVWGNLITSLVLSSGNNTAAVTSLNATMIPVICGANFLPNADAGEALPPQPPEKIQMMTGIFLVCIVSAALMIAIGVDSMKRYSFGRDPTNKLSVLALLTVTLKLCVEQNLMLLVFIDVYTGMQKAFFSADFTAAYISCAVGTGTVGYVVMTYGISNAFGCIINGPLAKMTARFPLVCAATLVHVALFTTLLTWRQQPGLNYVLYIVATLWGIADSMLIVQINVYHGILFPGREEAAFASYRLWESLGAIISYVISPYLRTSTKMFILLAILPVGFTCYLVVELRGHKFKENLKNVNKELSDPNACDNIEFQNVE